MKLLGKTDDGWICHATSDEVANLAGHSSAYSMTDRGNKQVSVGTIININQLYKNATETLSSYKEIRETFKRTQSAIAKLLGFMDPEKEEK